MIRYLFVTITLLVTPLAHASSYCEVLDAPGMEVKHANCERLVASGKINKDALEYTIKYMLRNHGALQDPSCAKNGLVANDRCIDCRSEKFLENGVENDCSFVVNDTKKAWTKPGEKAYRRSTAYYVDLCATDPSQVMESFYINGGTGKPYDDTPDRGTARSGWNTSTLAGAFLLEGKRADDFVVPNKEKYKNITAMYSGKIPTIRMVGLNSSNNRGGRNLKPMHVSAVKTGLGCLGVAPSSAEIMAKMVASGKKSLLMNWVDKEHFVEHGSCTNDHSDDDLPGAAPANNQINVTPAVRGAGSPVDLIHTSPRPNSETNSTNSGKAE
jgi:hypothetical protein